MKKIKIVADTNYLPHETVCEDLEEALWVLSIYHTVCWDGQIIMEDDEGTAIWTKSPEIPDGYWQRI